MPNDMLDVLERGDLSQLDQVQLCSQAVKALHGRLGMEVDPGMCIVTFIFVFVPFCFSGSFRVQLIFCPSANLPSW